MKLRSRQVARAKSLWLRSPFRVDVVRDRASLARVVDVRAALWGDLDDDGRLDVVRCLGCGATMPRERFQGELARLNPAWLALDATDAPDGDADLEQDFSSFVVPACEVCGGVLKPDVVFFGENVPRDTVAGCVEEARGFAPDMVIGIGNRWANRHTGSVD